MLAQILINPPLLLFLLLCSAESGSLSCSSAPCPAIAPVCDVYSYCECNIGAACTGDSVSPLSNNGANVVILSVAENYYSSYPPLPGILQLTYGFTLVSGSPNDVYNIYCMVYLGSAYVVVDQQLAITLGSAPFTAALPTLQLGMVNGQSEYILLVVQCVTGGVGNSIAITYSQSLSDGKDIFTIIAYVSTGLALIGTIIFLVLCLKKRRNQRLHQATREESSRKEFGIGHFELRMALFGVTAEIKRDVQTCSVCLQNFELDTLIRKTPCKHYFHQPCIDSWCRKNLTCPMCRADLDEASMLQVEIEGRKNQIMLNWHHSELEQHHEQQQEQGQGKEQQQQREQEQEQEQEQGHSDRSGVNVALLSGEDQLGAVVGEMHL